MSTHRLIHLRILWAGLLVVSAGLVGANRALANATLSAGEAENDGEPSESARAAESWGVLGTSSDRSGFERLPYTLRAARAEGDRLSMTRPVSPGATPATLLVTFDLRLSGITSNEANAQVFRVGSGFSSSNTDEADVNTYGKIGINTTRGGYQLRDLTAGVNSPTFIGTQAITWALNNSGDALSYPAPDGTVESIGNDRMDVWVGRTKVFDDISVTISSGSMTDLKWYWDAGTGTTTLGSFAIRPLPPVGSDTRVTVPAAPTAPSLDEAAAAMIGSIELYRPTPNPFEGTMRYAYAVAGAGERVDIGVYDVAGRRIRALVGGMQSPGRYEVKWDGLGGDGHRTQQGVYFLRAAIGMEKRVARIIYLKE